MTTQKGALRRLALIAAPCFVVQLAAGPSVQAQPAPAVVVAPGFTINKAMFSQTVYGPHVPQTIRASLERILAARIASLEEAWGLTPEQKEKLELAGKGDIKRRFDLIEDRQGIVNKPLDRDTYVKTIQELQELNRTLNTELFGAGSYFAKALKTTLTADQAERYGDIQRKKDQDRYQTRVEQFIIGLDNTLGMTTQQRRQLETLLLAETRPPRKFGPYDLMVVQYQMVRLPEARLKAIFDDAQWRSLHRRVEESRAMEQLLKNDGCLPDDVSKE